MRKKIFACVLVFLLTIPELRVLLPRIQAASDPYLVVVGISYEYSSNYGTPPLTMTPEGHMRLWYHTYNPNSFPINVILGASLQIGGSTYNDQAHDKTVTICPGDDNPSRYFYVPSGVPSGSYTVIYAIWAPDWSKQYSIMSEPGWLNMVSSVSVQLSNSPSNVGTISWDGVAYALPATVQTTTKQHGATCNPPSGYTFNTWQSTGSVRFDPDDQQTVNVEVEGLTGTLTAVLNPPSVPAFALSIDPSSLSIDQGASGNVAVQLQQMNGYNYGVSLTAYNQPSGVTIAFNPTEGTPTFSSTMNIQVGYTVPANVYPITIKATGSDPSQTTHEVTFSLTVGKVLFTNDRQRLQVSPPESYTAYVFGVAVTVTIYGIEPYSSHDDYRSALQQDFGIDLSNDFQTEAMFLIEVRGLYDLANYLSQQPWSSWAINTNIAAYILNQQEADGAIRIGVVWRDSIDFNELITSVVCTVTKLAKTLTGISPLDIGGIRTILQDISDVLGSFPVEFGIYRVFLNTPQSTYSLMYISTAAFAAWAQTVSDFLSRADVYISLLNIGLDIATLLLDVVDPAALVGWVLSTTARAIDTLIGLYRSYFPEILVDTVHMIASWGDPANVTADTQILSQNGKLVLGWNSTDNSFIEFSSVGFIIHDNRTQIIFLKKSEPTTIVVACHGTARGSIPYTLSMRDTYGNQTYVSSGFLYTNQSASMKMTFAQNVTTFYGLKISTEISDMTPEQGESVRFMISVNDSVEPRTDAAVALLINNLTWIAADSLNNGQYEATLNTSSLLGLTSITIYATCANMTSAYYVLILPVSEVTPGQVYINPDGSITPNDGRIFTRDKMTYTFAQNVNGSVIVRKNSIVLDGVNHTLLSPSSGWSGTGVNLTAVKNVTIRGIHITGFYYGVYVTSSSNTLIIGNNISNNDFGIELYLSNSTVLSWNCIHDADEGIFIGESSNNLCSDNSLSRGHTEGSVGIDIAGEIGSTANNTILGNEIEYYYYGIKLRGGTNTTFSLNIIDSGTYGLQCYGSESTMLISNTVTNFGFDGVVILDQSKNGLYQNVIANNWIGIEYGSGGSICNNTIRANVLGLELYSSGVLVSHNSFINNGQQAFIADGVPNIWDSGYPSGGNYWSDYVGVDHKRGPNQDQPGSDGIGDTPYVLCADDIDHYPLMAPTQISAIQIRTDGSVYPSNAPILRSGNVYTLIGDIKGYFGGITIERNNTILDGAGHTVQAMISDLYNSIGVDVSGRNNVTIKNIRIEAFYYGVFFNSCSCCDLSGNTISNNHIGVEIDSSYDCSLVNNNITNDGTGVELNSSISIVFSANSITTNNGNGLDFHYCSNCTSSANSLDANNGFGIYLEHSSNCFFSGNNVLYNDYGFYVSYCSNLTLSGNNVNTNNEDGIYLESSSGCALLTNSLNADGIGVELYCSYNIILSRNNVTENNGHGFDLYYCLNCTFLYNSINLNDGDGLGLAYCSNCSLSDNNLTDNAYDGIYTYFSSNNTILNNRIANNGEYGVWLDLSSTNNVLTGNLIEGNNEGICITGASGNSIYYNNFINNEVSSDGSPNTWDNGYPSGGNYWSDYNGTDLYSGPYQNVTGGDGIGDTPYAIDADNFDNHPLMNSYPNHDVAVTTLTATPSIVYQDSGCSMAVTVANKGDFAETFNVTIYVNMTDSGNITAIRLFEKVTLNGHNSETLLFTWDTTGFDLGTYTISASITPVQGETNLADNTFVGATVQIIQSNGGSVPGVPHMN